MTNTRSMFLLSLAFAAAPVMAGDPLLQARTMQLDERSGKLYSVTADMTVAAVDGTARANYFHPNSFTVMTYKPL